MTRGFFAVSIAVSLSILSGCASMDNLVSAPEVSLKDVEVTDLDLSGQTFVLAFDVINPNPFPLPVKSISYGVDLDGYRFASGSTVASIMIPAAGDANFAISVELNLMRTAPQLLFIVRDSLKLTGIRDDISERVELINTNPLIDLSLSEITYSANVSEFTEAEITALIRTRDLPRGQSITFNPSSVTIKYDVPLEQYAEISRIRPYEVFVPYQKIREDSTGFVTPEIELTASEYALKIRSFQPKAVAYFSVLDQ